MRSLKYVKNFNLSESSLKNNNISLYFTVFWKFSIMQDTSSLTVSDLYLAESTFAEDFKQEKSYASHQITFSV